MRVKCKLQAKTRLQAWPNKQIPAPGWHKELPIEQKRQKGQTTLAAQEKKAHIKSPSHLNKNNGTDQNKEGHHQSKIHKPIYAPEQNDNPWTVNQSRRPKKNKPAHQHSKLMEATERTTKELCHTPKGRTTLRMIIDTRSGISIHHKGDNIERRIITVSPNPAIDKI